MFLYALGPALTNTSVSTVPMKGLLQCLWSCCESYCFLLLECGVQLVNVAIEHASHGTKSLLHGREWLSQILNDPIQSDKIGREAHEIRVILVDEIDEFVLERGRVLLKILEHTLQWHTPTTVSDEFVHIEGRFAESILGEAQRLISCRRGHGCALCV